MVRLRCVPTFACPGPRTGSGLLGQEIPALWVLSVCSRTVVPNWGGILIPREHLAKSVDISVITGWKCVCVAGGGGAMGI